MAIALGSDNLVSLTGLLDVVTSLYVNAATVSAVLTDATATVITTITLVYITSSNGNYQGILPASITSTLANGVIYFVTVTATASGITWVDRQAHAASYANT